MTTKFAGSRRQCLEFTSADKSEVARRLSALAEPIASVDGGRDVWLPRGFEFPEEAKLGECELFLSPDIREALTMWWLAVRRGANTPNWDLVSSCSIEGKSGLILVEAKAHLSELSHAPKILRQPSANSKLNHVRIGEAIQEVQGALSKLDSAWNISRDSHYQLSNRIAWAWKIASLGVPVVLIYLGFCNVNERGKPFLNQDDWAKALATHSAAVMSEQAWGKRIETKAAPFWTLVRALDL